MDFDSSSKFISSLGKYLQSLCNGYVEFDNGVEVIGHIYLNVDTGKKIDYILNEKVFKTDTNSVTFVSNSFHAQPAEKPVACPNTSKSPKEMQSSDSRGSPDDEIFILDEEPDEKKSDLLPYQSDTPSEASRLSSYPSNTSTEASQIATTSKRSYRQSFSGNNGPHHQKHSRSSLSNSNSNSNGAHETNSAYSNPQSKATSDSVYPVLCHSVSSKTSEVQAIPVTDLSCVPEPHPQTFEDSSTSLAHNIKDEPTSETADYSSYNDVDVKQEHAHSSEQGTYEEQDSSLYEGDEYYGGNQGDESHTDYSQLPGQDHEQFYQATEQYRNTDRGDVVDGPKRTLRKKRYADAEAIPRPWVRSSKERKSMYREKIKADPEKHKAHRASEIERLRQYRASLTQEKKDEFKRKRRERYYKHKQKCCV